MAWQTKNKWAIGLCLKWKKWLKICYILTPVDFIQQTPTENDQVNPNLYEWNPHPQEKLFGDGNQRVA